ncbi:pentapeptide repeat-containing protein [Cupriavidus sp. AU9028]|uniref:pentapeptide repeat-containing protein n=1 Tax=Cupriavidus sp. AU9028 TaxID=2871157 RepID=UPI001C96916C|nr:pentapeptide repeat-containing protein [Cupriavidus sp. AU9028]
MNALLHVFRLHRHVVSAREVRERLKDALTTAYDRRAHPSAGLTRISDAVRAAAQSGLRVDLAGADLSGTVLGNVGLGNAILDGASLRGARWTGVSLREASLEGSDLTGVQFKDARFDATSLKQCQGHGAVFQNCEFRFVSFDEASLQAPEFDRCQLWSTTLRSAQLRNPCFRNLVTDGAWFASADFVDGGRLTFGPSPAPRAMQWLRPEPVGEEVARYWCTLLGRLHSAAAPLLEAAAVPLIEAVLSAAASMPDDSRHSATLLKAEVYLFLHAYPDYREHGPRNFQHAIDQQLQRTLDGAGARLLDWPDTAHQLASVAQMAVERLMNSHAPLHAAAALSPAIMQLVLLGRRPDAPKRAATVTEALEAIYRDCLPADMNRAIDAIEARDNERMFPLLSPDLSRVLLISPQYYEQRVRLMPAAEGEHRIPWTNLYRLTCTPDANGSAAGYQEGAASVPDDLSFCPLLAAVYRNQMSAGLHFEMLELFPLGSRFNAIFLAISSNVATERLVSEEHQTALHRIFDPMSMSSDAAAGLPMLVPSHEDALLRLASPQDGSISAAWLLLCLSVMWTRLSSEEFLGQTNDSPVAIRRYALALLNSAIARDSTLLTTDTWGNWQRRLCGTIDDHHTCTRILAANMLALLRRAARETPEVKRALDRVWPPAWREQ